MTILVITGPVPQDLVYHLLVDQRQWFTVPNLANIISNLPFATIGLSGLILCFRNKAIGPSWLTFFISLALVAPGSSYYHLKPNNQTLVWDRLPMTICFMSLFAALIVENISSRYEKVLLPSAILLGLSSVIYWHFTNDLRFYAFIQFTTLLSIPLILNFYQGQYSHRHYLLYGLLFYVLAKLFELNDNFIFELTAYLLSAHTIKHLLAAAATYCVYLMLKKRHRY
ncbi:MAG: ceramidase domain-containing protein [Methyloprofundus sp.]|nr:ceramidase domain-containing protein [Methyloprofundus sp.]MBW6452212.1 ceramidase domain-containing protein [Methyloprofundus sp.]